MMKNMTILTLDESLAKHLQEHAIPIHTTAVSACKIAIDCINRDDYNTMVELPHNIHFRRASTWELEQSIQAFKVVMFFHLENFLNENVREKFIKWEYS
jgi:hypothetical protein